MSELNDKRELNPALLRKMEVRIYGYEHENHKTKRLTDSEMVQKIRKIISNGSRSQKIEKSNGCGDTAIHSWRISYLC